MTKIAISNAMRKLPVMDRIELIEELWHSLAADQGEIPIPKWQQEMIDANLAYIASHPGEGMPLEEFKGKIKKELRKRDGRKR